MQYPEQVLDPRANRRSYKEILNNINTKIIGNIATDDMLAESLFHEDLDSDEIKDRIAGLRRGRMGRPAPIHGLSRTETRDSHPETTPHPTGTRRRSLPGSRPIRDGAPSEPHPSLRQSRPRRDRRRQRQLRRAAPQTNANKKSKTRTKTTWRTTPSPTSIARTSS